MPVTSPEALGLAKLSFENHVAVLVTSCIALSLKLAVAVNCNDVCTSIVWAVV